MFRRQGHPYFKTNTEFRRAAEALFGYRPPVSPDRFVANLAQYRTLDADDDYRLVDRDLDTGGYVFAHKRADKNDLKESIEAGKLLARNGHAVVIQPKRLAENKPNPDYLFDGRLSDLKTPQLWNVANGTRNAFVKAQRGLTNVVIHVKNDAATLNELTDGLTRGFGRNRSIEYVTLLWRGKTVRVPRSAYNAGTIIKLLADTWA